MNPRESVKTLYEPVSSSWSSRLLRVFRVQNGFIVLVQLSVVAQLLFSAIRREARKEDTKTTKQKI